MSACSVTLLGGFALHAADCGALALSTRKDRLLLAHLALSGGRPLGRDRLAGLLWADRGEAQARDSLRQSVAAIRQAFRRCNLDPIAGDRETLSFDPTGVAIDAVRFAELAANAADASEMEEAASLYRGDLLEGIDGVATEFDAWVMPERQRLAALATRLTERIAETGFASPIGVELARRMLSRDRVCEPAYRALMRLHIAGGERHAALKLYATCRDVLKQDLGVEPDLQTESLYRDILMGVQNPAARTEPVAAPARPSDRPSIAVLPFDNLSADPDLSHVCEGLAEDIITGLGRFRLLFVIDRHSSSTIAKQASDITEIGARLGVGHLVQGSLQRRGHQVRITVRLLDAATRAQMWGEAYDHPFADLADIPDTITRALVSTLYGRVESALMERVHRKPKLAAYDCVLRGVKYLRGYDPGDNERAVELFQQAVDLDPDYALARAYRGFADVVLHNYDETPSDVLARSLEMASTGLQMDPDDSRIHWLVGMICGFSGDLEGEEQHYQRAIELNPNDANVIASSGVLCAILGRPEEGIARIRQAMRLNPYHPEWYWVDLGTMFYMARRYDDAIEAYRHRTKPGVWVLSRLAACHAQMGRQVEAAAAAARVLQLMPHFSIARVRRGGWGPAGSMHIKEGMRKAGLPE